MSVEERALVGWKEIAQYLGVSLRTAKSKRKEFEKCGVIFQRWIGRPPRKYVCSFPNLLSRFFLLGGNLHD